MFLIICNNFYSLLDHVLLYDNLHTFFLLLLLVDPVFVKKLTLIELILQQHLLSINSYIIFIEFLHVLNRPKVLFAL